jgi:phosphoglucosamine mutase
MVTELFGTDGIRDIAGQGRLSPEKVRLVGRALGYIAAGRGELLGSASGTRTEILIACDTRASGKTIADQLADGITSAGCDVLSIGVAPTPVVAYLTTREKAAAGVVISASHNPSEYNGIKVFDSRALKASGEAEAAVEALVASPEEIQDAASPGRVSTSPASIMHYIEHVREKIANGFSIKDVRIVMDLGHGAMCAVAPQLFTMLGAKVVPINAEPDGSNINVNSGALHPEAAAQAVKEHNADIGLAFDGDGDRLILADETGAVRDGDYMMAICGRFLKDTGRLKNDLVVGTVMSNIGLERSLAECGAKLLRAPVGDRYVVEKMFETGAVLGGEQSGHIIFKERTTTGDGIWSALGVLEVMAATGRPLSELAACMEKYPQVLVNVRVKERKDLLSIPAVKKTHDEIVAKLADTGRIVLRYSGTEPLVRVMLEGEDQSEIDALANELADVIKKDSKR